MLVNNIRIMSKYRLSAEYYLATIRVQAFGRLLAILDNIRLEILSLAISSVVGLQELNINSLDLIQTVRIIITEVGRKLSIVMLKGKKLRTNRASFYRYRSRYFNNKGKQLKTQQPNKQGENTGDSSNYARKMSHTRTNNNLATRP
jgi:hypothetical protein